MSSPHSYRTFSVCHLLRTVWISTLLHIVTSGIIDNSELRHRMLGDDANVQIPSQGQAPPDWQIYGKGAEQTSQPEVPEYMQQLFGRFTNRNVPVQNTFANTVRSIHADIGMIDADTMLIFNLTGVHSAETHIHSELHLYRKRRSLDRNMVITLYELAPAYVSELGRVELSAQSVEGWLVLPMTEAVHSCLAVRRRPPHIFALAFSKVNSGGKERPMHMKALYKRMYKPYLVVYSNSSTSIAYDHVTARASVMTEQTSNTYINPQSGREEKFKEFRKIPSKEKSGKQNSIVDSVLQSESPANSGVPDLSPFANTNDADEYNTGILTRNSSLSNEISSNSVESATNQTRHTSNDTPKSEADASILLTKQYFLEYKKDYERKENSIHERFVRSVVDNRLPEESAHQPNPGSSDAKLPSPSSPSPPSSSRNLGSHFPVVTAEDSESLPDFDIFSEEYLQSQYFKLYQRTFESSQERRDRQQRRLSHQQQKQQEKSGSNPRSSSLSQSNDIFEIPYPPDVANVDYTFYSEGAPRDELESLHVFGEHVGPSQGHVRTCGVHGRLFDFADVGWREWVLQPQSFSANVCAGTCAHPDPWAAGQSNYAVLSGLSHTVGLHREALPQPCCVPANLDSQSVLYVDPYRNIVLKNYDSMRITECQCL